MTRRRAAAPRRLARQTAELSIAAPQVVARRLTRMAAAGPAPSAADQAEMARMVGEKVLAFQQSWLAMWGEALRLPFALTQAVALPAARGQAGAAGAALARGLAGAAAEVAAAGLAPVHRRAVANARRLSRRR